MRRSASWSPRRPSQDGSATRFPSSAGDRIAVLRPGDASWISDGVVVHQRSMERLRPRGRPRTRIRQTQPHAVDTDRSRFTSKGRTRSMVLYRVEEKAVQKIRIFSPDCELDAGGRTIHWLDGVNGADSVALLATFVAHDEVRNGIG